MTDRLRLGVFSPPVVLGVAAATGALRRAGLAIEEVAATSSSQQFAALRDRELDAALTSPDNVLAYRTSAANPLGQRLDVRILAAVDRGLALSLFAAPGLDPRTDLRGGVLAVDVATSGFAFVAYELLARLGLPAQAEPRAYEVRALGSTPRRAEALVAGECAMTVLNAGSDLRAEAAGCVRVARAASLGRYVGTVLAATGDRVEDLRALTTVIVATTRALAEGALVDVAEAVAADRLGLDAARTSQYVASLRDLDEGLIPDGRLDPLSLDTLRRLRERYGDNGGEPAAVDLAAVVAPGSGLIDERYL